MNMSNKAVSKRLTNLNQLTIKPPTMQGLSDFPCCLSAVAFNIDTTLHTYNTYRYSTIFPLKHFTEPTHTTPLHLLLTHECMNVTLVKHCCFT